jgi:hypothetical protein
LSKTTVDTEASMAMDLSYGGTLSDVGLPGTTPIMTRHGWRPLRALRCGDSLVVADGSARSLKAVIPRGVGRVAELGLADGSALTAGLGQLWDVQVGSRDTGARLTLSTGEIAAQLSEGRHPRLTPLAPLELGAERAPMLDGYVLGCLLGDGSLTGHTPVLWSTQLDLVARFAACLPVGARLTDRPRRQARCTGWAITGTKPGVNPVTDALRRWDLLGRRSFEKRVPPELLLAPREYRLELVRGTFDSDGCVDVDGRVTFNSASEGLVRDVVALIRGLGGRTSPVRARTSVFYTVRGSAHRIPARPSYRVGVHLPEPVFRLPRKAARLPTARRTTYWTISSVRDAGVAPLYVLELDGGPEPRLVAGDYLPVAAVPLCAEATAAVGRVA